MYPLMPQQGQACHNSLSNMPAGSPPIWGPLSLTDGWGSEAKEMTGRVHNNWLFAPRLLVLHCFSWIILQNDSFRNTYCHLGLCNSKLPKKRSFGFFFFNKIIKSQLQGWRGGGGEMPVSGSQGLIHLRQGVKGLSSSTPFHWLHTHTQIHLAAWIRAWGYPLATRKQFRGQSQALMNPFTSEESHQADEIIHPKWAQTDSVLRDESVHAPVALPVSTEVWPLNGRAAGVYHRQLFHGWSE